MRDSHCCSQLPENQPRIPTNAQHNQYADVLEEQLIKSTTLTRRRVSCPIWSREMMYSPIHKVRLSVGYLAYPREKKERAQSRRVTLHTIQAHMLPVPTEKQQREASGLRERAVSLWDAAQRVQTPDEMLRAPPFAGPLRPPFLSLSLDAVNNGTRSKLSASRQRDPRTPGFETVDPRSLLIA